MDFKKLRSNEFIMRDNRVLILVLVVVALLFFGCIASQLLSSANAVIIICCVVQMLLSLGATMLLDRMGYAFSMVLNLIAIAIFLFEAISYKNEDGVFIVAFAVASILVCSFFIYYSTNVNMHVYKLRSMYKNVKEYNFQLTEENKVITSTLNRTNLIVKHNADNPSDDTLALAATKYKNIDALTSLPNRALLLKRIDSLIAERIERTKKGELSTSDDNNIRVIYLCIDNFSALTREFGHFVVDIYVQSMAHRIREATDPADMVGRIMSSEFAIVISREIDDYELGEYCRKLSAAMRVPFEGVGEAIDTKVAIGMSLYPRDTRFSGELLRCAEMAMNRASVEPACEEMMIPNCNIIDYPEIAHHFRGRITPVSKSFDLTTFKDEIESALKMGEFYMVFQPQFRRDKKIAAFESFLRWNSSKYGVLNAGDFMELADKTGAITELGKFGREQALAILKEVNKIDDSIKMILNLSAVELGSVDLPAEFATLITKYNLKPENIVLDTPEESLLTSFEQAKTTLSALSVIGVTIDLDNFGRGYSSLNNIPLLPISAVKIGSNISSVLPNDKSMRILTSNIIKLMHEIDIKVAATSISNEEEYELLYAMGCDMFQGIYINEPITMEEMEGYMARHT